MSELDPQIKMGLEIVGLPTSIEDAKIWIEDPDNLKTAQSLLEKYGSKSSGSVLGDILGKALDEDKDSKEE